MMNNQGARVGWGFWLWWVLASFVGLAVGFAVAAAAGWLGAAARAVGSLGEVVGAEGMAMAGASLGIAQWLVLRRQVSRPGWWVLASTAGLAVGLAVGFAVFEAASWLGAVGGAVGGASLGIAQWLVLRRQVSRPGWWVLASTVGGAWLGAVVAAVGFAMNVVGASIVAMVVALLVALAGYGAITGGVLVWLLRQPVTEEPSLRLDAA